MDLARHRVKLHIQCTEEKPEQEAERCQEPMCKDLDATPKRIRMRHTTMRWWNADIKDRRRTVG